VDFNYEPNGDAPTKGRCGEHSGLSHVQTALNAHFHFLTEAAEMKPVLLSGRNSFADWAHVPSILAFEGRSSHQPLISIAIPTFRRFDLLSEAVESALAQNFDRPVEIVVVDNEPASHGAERLVKRLPALRDATFRYYVNAENIGMFGNWNRCIELGRGAWHTLLNDDDRLAPDFCTGIFAVLDAHPEIDGAICRKRLFGAKMPESREESDGASKRLLQRAWLEYRFHGRPYRPLTADKFFWGSLVGNTVGMVARKSDLIALGGYDPNDYPSADHLMMLRFAMAKHFVEVRQVLAQIRLEENESAKPEVLLGFIERNQDIRRAMAGKVVPHWWLGAFSSLMVSRHRAVIEPMFHGSISDTDLEAVSGVRTVKDRKWLLNIACAALGGF
jgi:glycosyltransferase involved in cell wall biosynthesis